MVKDSDEESKHSESHESSLNGSFKIGLRQSKKVFAKKQQDKSDIIPDISMVSSSVAKSSKKSYQRYDQDHHQNSDEEYGKDSSDEDKIKKA